MPVARVLALLVGLLVVWRVVPSGLRTVTGGRADGLTLVATGVLLVAGVALVVSAARVALGGDGRRWLAAVLPGFLVVMTGYLVLGLALGRQVPWTAYAVLVGVAALGGGALVLLRRPT